MKWKNSLEGFNGKFQKARELNYLSIEIIQPKKQKEENQEIKKKNEERMKKIKKSLKPVGYYQAYQYMDISSSEGQKRKKQREYMKK